MAKTKYYAVKVGKNMGIFQTWAQCEEQIKGVSGAQYKSFTTLEDAERYIQTPLTEETVKEEKPKRKRSTTRKPRTKKSEAKVGE